MIRPSSSPRAGVVLIVVIGIAGLLISLMMAFLMMISSSSSASETTARVSQARLMLHAACAYILEAGRLGYDQDVFYTISRAPLPNQHREAFGWVDVRDASRPTGALPGTQNSANGTYDPQHVGPRDQFDQRVQPVDRVWPNVGGTVICPMYRWQRPPWAIRSAVAYNPIVTDPTKADFGFPYLRYPDPQPAVDNGFIPDPAVPGTANDANWNAFRDGDPTPVQRTMGVAWYRIHRLSPSRFVVTCGAGGTMGFRDWDEVAGWAPPSASRPTPSLGRMFSDPVRGTLVAPSAWFAGSRALFDSLRASEIRQWYLVQWSASVKPPTDKYARQGTDFADIPTYNHQFPFTGVNATNHTGGATVGFASRYMPAPLGSISFIQRLDGPPAIGATDPETGSAWNW